MKHLPSICRPLQYVIGIMLLIVTDTSAQTSFDRIRTIFNANCTVGCHSGASPSAQLDLTGTTEQVFIRLAGTVPLNPAAVSAGYKLVDPGYPERSFLFVKVAGDIDPVTHLQPPMGGQMPSGQPQMDHDDIEMVRQWILFGADTVSDYVDPQLLTDYYSGQGSVRMQPLAPPDASEGFQIHYGPFFLEPLSETEYFYKYATGLPETVEVNRVNVVINEGGHHTALYRYFPDADTNFAPGLRYVENLLVAAGVYFTSDIIGQWPNSQDLVLPEGTAFTWMENVVVDLNYHVANYSPDSIMAAEWYMNVYTQPEGTAQQEMISAPIYYGGEDPTTLEIPGNTFDSIYRIDDFNPDSAYTRYVWSMMAHTHKLGTDYQVWLRNPDGTKGENIYNGHYDPTYSFDLGAYDWAHPPFRMFNDELLEVNYLNGMIHEATFTNPTPETVWFGVRTTDEMYVTYIQYVEEPLNIGIKEQGTIDVNPLKVYPNPSAGDVNLAFDLPDREDVRVSILNELGQEVFQRYERLGPGRVRIRLNRSETRLSEGVYLIRVSSDSRSYSSRSILF